MSFSSLTGTEFEPDVSSFCPGQTKSHSLHHIFHFITAKNPYESSPNIFKVVPYNS